MHQDYRAGVAEKFLNCFKIESAQLSPELGRKESFSSHPM